MKKLLIFLLSIASTSQTFSQWNNNPMINNLVVNAEGQEYNPFAVTDGSNGSILIFNNNEKNIYAQKITSTGAVAWGSTSNPVLISEAEGDQDFTHAIADGAGGAYIAWVDYRDNEDLGEIYMQHINSGGVTLWPANGVRVTNANARDDEEAFLCSDGSGGVIVSWSWNNYVDNLQIAAQRYNSAGVAQWAAEGIQICNAPGFRGVNSIVSDGQGGAILFFIDTRDDPHGTDYNYFFDSSAVNLNIYAQRLNGNGLLLWGNNGVPVCKATGNQYTFNGAVADGNGGAIGVFEDERNSVPDTSGFPDNTDIYSQKLNSSGIAQWDTDGIPFIRRDGDQYAQAIESDGSGGIVAAWSNEDDNFLYTQKISNNGTVSWPVNGLLISPVKSYSPSIVADGKGNYLYSFLIFNPSLYVHAQKVNAAGELQWAANGAVVCNNPTGKSSLGAASIVLSNDGSAIISWQDYRNLSTTGYDIYASKILSTGLLDDGSNAGFVSITNGNWNDPAIWRGGVAPGATANVTVRHNVTVTANASCNSLSVETSDGFVTVKTGVQLTIAR